VNLLFGAFYDFREPENLVGSLMDGLTRDRVEVDMIKFCGPAFQSLDNRLMSLQLVQQRLTNAAIFTAQGEVAEPTELLHRRPVLIERGSFRPVTNVTLDMLECATAQMRGSADMDGSEPLVLMEMTLRNLLTVGQQIEHGDFLARVDTLGALGKTVMVSNYSRFHNVAAYLRRYTREPIVMVLGVPTLAQILNDEHYRDLDAGVLEAIGRLFKGALRLYIYPWRNDRTGELVSADNFRVAPHLRHLYAHLLENHYIESIRNYTQADLSILPGDILTRLQTGDPTWEALVPPSVAQAIKAHRFFGYHEGSSG
jgi:hypothetical protein